MQRRRVKEAVGGKAATIACCHNSSLSEEVF
jgi:hypothetical protein